jgi:hypothetical protein
VSAIDPDIMASLDSVPETRARLALYAGPLTHNQRRAMETRYPEGAEKPIPYSVCGKKLYQSPGYVQQCVKAAFVVMERERRRLRAEGMDRSADYDRGYRQGKIAGARELIEQLKALVGELESPIPDEP